MTIDALITRLRQDRVRLDPDVDADLATLREEVEDFAQAMRRGKGRQNDAPRMYCSALINDAVHARNICDFKDAVAVVVSVGGTNTHYRALEIKGGRITERTDVHKTLHGEKIPTKIPTPCGDGKKHKIEEMLTPIVRGVLPWLDIFLAEKKTPHILLNWGFPQKSVLTPPHVGITGAIGERMTKGQCGVDANGREIHTVFMQVLRDIWDRPEQDLGLRITVQNDTIMALYRYLEKRSRDRYARFALMIVGTGTNLTASESYLFDSGGHVMEDEEGYPVRLPRGEKAKPGFSSREAWVNFETGRLSLTQSRTGVDRLLPGEEDMLEDIENFGASGTGFPRIFRNLIVNYLDEGERVFRQFSRVVEGINLPLDAECVTQCAGAHAAKGARDITAALRESGFTDESLLVLQYLSGIVVYRSALRNAQVLSALSLFSGFGLHKGDKPDALAMEGSIWKSVGYTDRVFDFWNKLLGPELRTLGRSQVNVAFVVEDDYNAGVLGPAYLLGQFL